MSLLDIATRVNRYQTLRMVHPLTCGKCAPPERDEHPLYAVVEGYEIALYCPLGDCDYYQVMSLDLIDVVLAMEERL